MQIAPPAPEQHVPRAHAGFELCPGRTLLIDKSPRLAILGLALDELALAGKQVAGEALIELNVDGPTGELTGPAPEPSLGGGGGSSAAEQPGGHSETNTTADEPVAEPEPAVDPGQGPAAGSGGAQPYGAGEQTKRQAASGLPMIQQTVDTHDAPSNQPLPTTVAFPWTLDESGEADGMTGEAQYDQGGQVPSGHQSHASLRPGVGLGAQRSV